MQTIVQVRVRPAHVGLLIATTATENDLLLGIRFLSSLWGGRYSQIIPVEPGEKDSLALFRLSQSRPDYVYAIGIDYEQYKKLVVDECQPRGFGPLRNDYVENLHDSIEEHVTTGHIIYHLINRLGATGRREKTLRLIECDASSPLLPYAAASFGLHSPSSAKMVVLHQVTPLSVSSPVTDFIEAYTGNVRNFERCWLDLASYDLTPRITGWTEIPPTIVLVESLVQDLAWYWNLRMVEDSEIPACVIPIPLAAVNEPALLTSALRPGAR